MKGARVIIIFLIIIAVLALVLYLLFADHKNYVNTLVVKNNLPSDLILTFDCTPDEIDCQHKIEKDQEAKYKNLERLGVQVGSWFEFDYYDLYLPEIGRYTIDLKTVITGKIPEGFKMRCFKGQAHQDLVEINCQSRKELHKN